MWMKGVVGVFGTAGAARVFGLRISDAVLVETDEPATGAAASMVLAG